MAALSGVCLILGDTGGGELNPVTGQIHGSLVIPVCSSELLDI